VIDSYAKDNNLLTPIYKSIKHSISLHFKSAGNTLKLTCISLYDLDCVPLSYYSVILSKLGRHQEAISKGEESYECFSNTDHPSSEQFQKVKNLITIHKNAGLPLKATNLFDEYSQLLREKYDQDQRKILIQSELARSN